MVGAGGVDGAQTLALMLGQAACLLEFGVDCNTVEAVAAVAAAAWPGLPALGPLLRHEPVALADAAQTLRPWRALAGWLWARHMEEQQFGPMALRAAVDLLPAGLAVLARRPPTVADGCELGLGLKLSSRTGELTAPDPLAKAKAVALAAGMAWNVRLAAETGPQLVDVGRERCLCWPNLRLFCLPDPGGLEGMAVAEAMPAWTACICTVDGNVAWLWQPDAEPPPPLTAAAAGANGGRPATLSELRCTLVPVGPLGKPLEPHTAGALAGGGDCYWDLVVLFDRWAGSVRELLVRQGEVKCRLWYLRPSRHRRTHELVDCC